LCPVAAGPAPLHGCRPSDDAELTSYDEFAYSFAYAIAGLPAASVPAGGERGLPVGVQVVARAFRDDVALAVAGVLEQALADAVPPLPS
ncbi:MAG TPA: amidase family protein, partial [Gaiellaceae bacterium]